MLKTLILCSALLAPALAEASISRSQLVGTWDMAGYDCIRQLEGAETPAEELLPPPERVELRFTRARMNVGVVYFGCMYNLDTTYSLNRDLISYPGNTAVGCDGSRRQFEPVPFRGAMISGQLHMIAQGTAGLGQLCSGDTRARFVFNRRR